MISDILVSIVIPVYNVEAYLEACVASIAAQTYTNIEIILVNDGSTDRSGKICDELCLKDSRIRVFHKENGGLMSAWKHGVMQAGGDYVGFVDSDDWVDNNMFSQLLSIAEENDSDIVACGLIKEYESGKHEKEKILIAQGEYGSVRLKEQVWPRLICSGTVPERGLSPNRVTKLFRKKLLMENMALCDTDVSIGEDLVTTFAAVTKAKKIIVLTDFFPYHYRINDESMIRKYTDQKYDSIRILSNAMERINAENQSLFTAQLANDYISLILQQMEEEILASGYSKKIIAFDLQREYLRPEFQQSLKLCDYKKLRSKYKAYLFLLKYHMGWVMIAARKLKGSRG